MLLSKVNKILIVLIPLPVALISVVVWQLWDMKRFHESPEVHEVPVTVTGIKQMKNGLLEVSGSAVASDPENADNYVLRLQHLYAEKVDVSVSKETGDTYLLSSRDLKPGDLLIENPETIQSGQAILPVSGVDDSRIISLIIKACIAATTEKNRDDLFRFVSTEYMDSLGFNRMFMGRFVHRIFEELERDRRCMPCRQKMSERFGPYDE